MPKDDLMCLVRTDPRWIRLTSVLTVKTYKNPDKVKKNYRNFMTQVSVANAFMAEGLKESSLLEKKIMVGLSAMFYSVFRCYAVRRARIFMASPNVDVARSVWNLVDSWLVSNVVSILLPSIKLNQVVYVPRTVSHVSNHDYLRLDTDQKFSFSIDSDKVMARLLCSFDPTSIEDDSVLCIRKREKELKMSCTKLIFHIHGGGFVSMSSASHQVYTRSWAKKLDVPVFSVDYRLAPDNPYPDALDDVWQAYCWVVNNIESQLGINPIQIIVAGDSAGGNLSLALTIKTITSGFRIPDGLLLSYPAVDLNKNRYTPSMLYSIEDLLIPHTFLKICRSSYLQNSNLDPETDMYISPLKAPAEILCKFPATRIMVGQCDSLIDDCYRLTEKIMDAGCDVKLKVFEGTPHGALNFCLPTGVKESSDLLDQSLEFLDELFSLKN